MAAPENSHLPIELLEKITGLPSPKLGEYHKGEKRSSDRLPVSLGADLWMAETRAQQIAKIRIRNISCSGGELICRPEMTPAEPFHLRFVLEDEAMLIECETVRCMEIAAGQFLVAAVFRRQFGLSRE